MKKLNIIFLLVIVLTSGSFAYPIPNQLKGREFDFDNTYSYLSFGPDLVCDGELVVLGDSFGFLFCDFVEKGVNYVVHQGYDIAKIYFEFLPLIESGRYKYAFILIGPNDFMMQTKISAFRSIYQLVVADLLSKGMQVIVTDYCDPDYNDSTTSMLYHQPIKCREYDMAIKEVKNRNNILYVEMKDLLAVYGRMPMDAVHPDRKLYGPLLERVEMLIANDKILKGK